MKIKETRYSRKNHKKGIINRPLSVASRHKIDRLYSFTWGVVFTVAFIALCFKYIVVTNQAYEITGDNHNFIKSLEIIKGAK